MYLRMHPLKQKCSHWLPCNWELKAVFAEYQDYSKKS